MVKQLSNASCDKKRSKLMADIDQFKLIRGDDLESIVGQFWGEQVECRLIQTILTPNNLN